MCNEPEIDSENSKMLDIHFQTSHNVEGILKTIGPIIKINYKNSTHFLPNLWKTGNKTNKPKAITNNKKHKKTKTFGTKYTTTNKW